MSPFDKLFQAQVDKLLSANDKRRAFFFRGFLPKQIEFLIKHKTSLYMNEDFIEDDCLQIQKIEANKRALVKQLTLAENSVVGFYEELVAISSAVKDVSLVFDGEIVIIDNPLFESNVPSPLSLEQAVALFEYMQTDGKAENDTLEVLNRYYHEVNFLDADHVLVALANVHEDAHYLRLPLFDNKDLTEMAMINQPADEILEGSSEDWLYRFSVMSGAANEIVYVVDSVCPHNLEKGLFTVLAALSIPHSIRRVDTRIPEMEYDDSQFEKYLRRYWGPQAKFRELKFYKQPSVSKEITIISQGALVSEIIDQCEAARDEDCTYRDIFITAPTGAGKSLLFQLPALYMAEKYGLITIVVTPLVALMHDQVAQLERERGVKNATFLNSKITFEERQQRIQEIHDGKKSIIYLAPELLLASGLQPIVGERSVGLLVIDEVHTVTSWGRDFRPDYCFLGDFLKTIKRTGQRFPLLCLTATAVYSGPDDVVNDTIAELDLHNPILHLGNVKRDNINFEIKPGVQDGSGKRVETVKQELIIERLIKYVSKGEKTLVYCPYRSQVDSIYGALPTEYKIKIRRYHSKIHDAERKITERDYRDGKAIALICTKAFGMGIDVKDIKHIIHFAPSGNLSDYVQEVGRAARDNSIVGLAHMDFFSSDMRYVKSLNGISEMKQYQLREMLKKLYSIYSVKNHRNLLVAPDSFAYLFEDSDLENRTKSGFILLAKDLKNKYGIPILIVRPKAMLTKNYVNVPPEIEQEFLAAFGNYATPLGFVSDRVEASRNPSRGSDIRIRNHGKIYSVQMGELWENHFADITFGAFKRLFFQGDLLKTSKNAKLSPRINVSVQYDVPFEEVVQKITLLFETLVKVFSEIKSREKRTFEEKELYAILKERLPEFDISSIQLGLILDMITLNVDENAAFTESRNSVRILQKRKQKNQDAYEYLIGNYYSIVKDYMIKYLYQCQPNREQTFQSYVPMGQENTISILPVLKLLQILEYASYELRGGEKAEIFIRINDPEKIRYLANSNYKNGMLQEIVRRHRQSQELLFSFFTKDMDDPTRWELIEDYFLGRTADVEELLGVEFSLQ